MENLKYQSLLKFDENIIAPSDILKALSGGSLDEIVSNNGYSWRLAGRSEEQK